MPTLQNAVDTYLKLDKARHTIKTYRSCLLRLIKAFDPDRPVDSLTYSELVDYFYQFRAGVKQSTQFNYLVILKTFFKWCVGEAGYLQTSPIEKLHIRRPAPDPLESRAIPKNVLGGMYEQTRLKLPKFSIRDYAILCFIDETGCRRGAVADMTIQRLNLEKMEAYLREKGGDKKTLHYTQQTVDALRDWLAIRPKCKHDFVFTANRRKEGYPALKAETIAAMIRRLSEKAGGRAYGPHRLRHRTAQDMRDNGEPIDVIQKKLNHKHIETTERYLGPASDQVREATQRRAARNRPSVPVPSELERGRYAHESGKPLIPIQGRVIYLDFNDVETGTM